MISFHLKQKARRVKVKEWAVSLILFGVVFISMTAIVFLFEIGLTMVEGYSVFPQPIRKVRAIRLKENLPNFRFEVSPDEAYLKKTDSLAKEKFVFEMDENGFIKPSKIHNDPDYQLVFLGGSTTECMYVNDKKRFPYLAGRLVEERSGKKINSFNGGVSGNHSLHSINILINKVVPMKPDMVFLLHNVNDLNILLYEGSYWNSNPTRSPVQVLDVRKGEDVPTPVRRIKDIIRALIPHLYQRLHKAKIDWSNEGGDRTGNPAYDEFAHLRSKKIVIQPEKMLAEYTRNLNLFVDIVRDSGAAPVLITQANRITDNPDPVVQANMKDLEDMGVGYLEYKSIYDRFNQAIRDVGNNRGIFVIDLESRIPKESRYMYDTMHFNDVGSETAAEIIADCLREQHRM